MQCALCAVMGSWSAQTTHIAFFLNKKINYLIAVKCMFNQTKVMYVSPKQGLARIKAFFKVPMAVLTVEKT